MRAPSTRAGASALYDRASRWRPAGFGDGWTYRPGVAFDPESHAALEEMLRAHGWTPARSIGMGSRWRREGVEGPYGADTGVPFIAAVVATFGALAGRMEVPGVVPYPVPAREWPKRYTRPARPAKAGSGGGVGGSEAA